MKLLPLLFVCGLMFACSSSSEARTRIEMVDQVVTGQSLVHLGDIAHIVGPHAAILEKVRLATLTRDEQPVRLDADRILRMLRLQQPALASEVHLVGASCVVTRRTGATPAVQAAQTVTLRSGTANVTVEQSVIARRSGNPGELVPVMEPRTGRLLQARIVGPGQVELQ